MYEAYYGFREKPFNLTPDPKFLYLSVKHHEAFAHLEFGLEQRGGFMVITGEVGTGKTTLCRYFLDRLDERTVSAFILYPALGTTELLRSINRDLGVSNEGETDKELIDALHRFLLDSRQANKNIVLVIDEAQNLSRDVLEQVRLISNLETDTEKLIQIVLIGQSELNDKLGQDDLRQLEQRITARYHLTPLSRSEMTQYIRHRLAVAGGLGRVDFTSGALRVVHRFSQGVPRLINLVCDRSLLAGYVLEKNEIDARLVRQAIKELNMRKRRSWFRRPRWAVASVVGVAAALLAGLGIAGYRLVDGGPFSLKPSALIASVGSSSSTSAAGMGAVPTMTPDELAEHFELRLVTLSRELSRQAASAVLLERWGIRLGGGLAAISALEDMPALAERAALEYSELATNISQLRALNLPAVLELMHPSKDRIVFVTLTSLEGDSAILYFAPGDFFKVPISVLEKYWTGRARLFWRDFEQLRSSDAGSQLSWARLKLKTLGMLPSDGADDAEGLEQAVRELQKKVQIEPTGIVSPETRMAIYSLDESYRVPRLFEP
jgi:general secretion pathway protein A